MGQELPKWGVRKKTSCITKNSYMIIARLNSSIHVSPGPVLQQAAFMVCTNLLLVQPKHQATSLLNMSHSMTRNPNSMTGNINMMTGVCHNKLINTHRSLLVVLSMDSKHTSDCEPSQFLGSDILGIRVRLRKLRLLWDAVISDS